MSKSDIELVLDLVRKKTLPHVAPQGHDVRGKDMAYVWARESLHEVIDALLFAATALVRLQREHRDAAAQKPPPCPEHAKDERETQFSVDL
jgi:hypothetical protein